MQYTVYHVQCAAYNSQCAVYSMLHAVSTAGSADLRISRPSANAADLLPGWRLQGCRQHDPRLEAAGCTLQGCRPQCYRPQVACWIGLSMCMHSAHSGSCKGAGRRIQGCRQQVVHCKTAGCKAPDCWLHAARGQAWARAASTATAFAMRRKRGASALWHSETATPSVHHLLQLAKPSIHSQKRAVQKDPSVANTRRMRWGVQP